MKAKRAEDIRKSIAVKSVKAGTHTMDEVADYIVNELGYTKKDTSDHRYQETLRQMRASYVMMYRPDLLGELSELPELINHDEESIKAFLKKAEQRQKAFYQLMTKLNEAEVSIKEEGTISADELEKELQDCIPKV